MQRGSLTRASKLFNKHHNYFSVVKKVSPKKFEYIKSLDDDFVKAVLKYDDYVGTLIKKAIDVRYSFDKDSELYHWLVDNNIEPAGKQTNNVVRDFDCTLFNIKKDNFAVKFDLIEKFERIIALGKDRI